MLFLWYEVLVVLQVLLLRAWIHCAVKIGIRKINLTLLWPWRYFLEIILNAFLLCLSVRHISSKSSGQGKFIEKWLFYLHFFHTLSYVYPQLSHQHLPEKYIKIAWYILFQIWNLTLSLYSSSSKTLQTLNN